MQCAPDELHKPISEATVANLVAVPKCFLENRVDWVDDLLCVLLVFWCLGSCWFGLLFGDDL